MSAQASWLSPILPRRGRLPVDPSQLDAALEKLRVGEAILALATYDAIRVRAARLGISIRSTRQQGGGYWVRRLA